MDTTAAIGLITAAGSGGFLVGVKSEMKRQEALRAAAKAAEKAAKKSTK